MRRRIQSAPGGPRPGIPLRSGPRLCGSFRSPMEQAKLFGVRPVPIGKESVMRNRVLSSAALLTLLALPLAACQTGTATGAAGGAVTGAVVGGPVGAVVGGVAGAAVGSALSAEESTRVRTFTVAQRRPSIRMTEEVVVGSAAAAAGEALPGSPHGRAAERIQLYRRERPDGPGRPPDPRSRSGHRVSSSSNPALDKGKAAHGAAFLMRSGRRPQSSSIMSMAWVSRRMSRLPAWLAGPTMPSFSIRSISDAARL